MLQFTSASRRALRFFPTSTKFPRRRLPFKTTTQLLSLTSHYSTEVTADGPQNEGKTLFIPAKARHNQIKVQQLSDVIYKQVFPRQPETGQGVPAKLIYLSCEHLKKHDLLDKNSDNSPPIGFNLPPLVGRSGTLDEHFHRLGLSVAEPYLTYAKEFACTDIPNKPAAWVKQAGWTKYQQGEEPIAVPYPDEKMLVFDTEVLYKRSPFAVMACAVSPTAWYAWISPWLLDQDNWKDDLLEVTVDDAAKRSFADENVIEEAEMEMEQAEEGEGDLPTKKQSPKSKAPKSSLDEAQGTDQSLEGDIQSKTPKKQRKKNTKGESTKVEATAEDGGECKATKKMTSNKKAQLTESDNDKLTAAAEGSQENLARISEEEVTGSKQTEENVDAQKTVAKGRRKGEEPPVEEEQVTQQIGRDELEVVLEEVKPIAKKRGRPPKELKSIEKEATKKIKEAVSVKKAPKKVIAATPKQDKKKKKTEVSDSADRTVESVEERKEEGTAEEAAVEAVTEEVAVEAVAEEVAVEAVAEEVAVEAVAVEAVAVEAVAVEAVAEEVAKEVAVEEVTEEVAVEAVAEEAAVEAVAEEVAVEAVAEEELDVKERKEKKSSKKVLSQIGQTAQPVAEQQEAKAEGDGEADVGKDSIGGELAAALTDQPAPKKKTSKKASRIADQATEENLIESATNKSETEDPSRATKLSKIVSEAKSTTRKATNKPEETEDLPKATKRPKKASATEGNAAKSMTRKATKKPEETEDPPKATKRSKKASTTKGNAAKSTKQKGTKKETDMELLVEEKPAEEEVIGVESGEIVDTGQKEQKTDEIQESSIDPAHEPLIGGKIHLRTAMGTKNPSSQQTRQFHTVPRLSFDDAPVGQQLDIEGGKELVNESQTSDVAGDTKSGNSGETVPEKVKISDRHLIPLGPPDVERIIVGHNIGYDRARIKEEYNLLQTRNAFLDTMSLHVAVNGMCSRQRPTWLKHRKNLELKAKMSEEADTEDKKQTIEGLQFNEEELELWIGRSSINSLKEVAEFHCQKIIDKDVRDQFGSLDRAGVVQQLDTLLDYCASDVVTTFEVYQKVLPEFLSVCPHPVSFGALRHLTSVMLPVSEEWESYIMRAEEKYKSLLDEIQQYLVALVEAAIAKFKNEGMEEIKKDPWLSQLDWTVDEIRYFKPKKGDTDPRPDPRQKLPGYPKWYRDLVKKEGDKPTITVRSRPAVLFLGIEYEGYPLVWSDVYGWTYKVPIANAGEYDGKNVTKCDFSAEEKQLNLRDDKEHVYFKVPHKDGPAARCVNPLAKSFTKQFENGTIKGNSSMAQKALEMNAQCSYWISSRERIMSQMVVYEGDVDDMGFKPGKSEDLIDAKDRKKLGMILPQLIPMGTITRRAVERTWLTASNAKKNRVGSELKSMVKAPPGYSFVGADVDSQELWIASLVGDAQLKIHGGTAFGFMTLEGTRSAGTDLHSKTASILGISRNHAKIFNYGRIYGAGLKFAATLLRQFNPAITDADATKTAENLYAATKGQKLPRRKLAMVERPFWYGGTESFVFNCLEEFAEQDRPRTPVLGAGLTEALMREYLSKGGFMTSRINWAIQSSGVDYLHLLIVSMDYLIRRYNLDARLAITVHDEIRYLVRNKDRYRAALALQIANVWVRAMFSQQMGINDLPQSCAYFSAVDIDTVLRKEVDMDCITPSNPTAIPPGESLDIMKLLEKGSEAELVAGKDDQLEEELLSYEYDERIPVMQTLQQSRGTSQDQLFYMKAQLASKEIEVVKILKEWKGWRSRPANNNLLEGNSAVGVIAPPRTRGNKPLALDEFDYFLELERQSSPTASARPTNKSKIVLTSSYTGTKNERLGAKKQQAVQSANLV